MFYHKFKNKDHVFVTGCPHLQHSGITRGVSHWENKDGTRDFETTEEMTRAVLLSLQDVPEHAHLFILGDMLFGVKSNIYDILDQIPCKNLYYLYGNHCQWMRWDKYKELSTRFKWMGDYLEVFYQGRLVVMSHYPFSVWNESHKGSWMLCSHSHGTFAPSLPETKDKGKILDCGWDVHNRPIDILEIESIMSTKMIYNPDHHDQKTTG